MKFVTFSFDDGEVFDERLCDLFRKYSLKASFALRSNCCGLHGDIFNADGSFFRHYDIIGKEDIARIYSGFEICSHGANHSGFAGKTIAELKQEIYPDLALFEKLMGNKVIGAVYPGGAYDGKAIENLKEIGIKYCRTIPDGTYNFSVPSEWECWVPTCHFQDENIFGVIDRFASLSEKSDAILHIFGHSYELEYKDRDWWAVAEKICRKVKNLENVRYATLGEIYHYFHGKDEQ